MGIKFVKGRTMEECTVGWKEKGRKEGSSGLAESLLSSPGRAATLLFLPSVIL